MERLLSEEYWLEIALCSHVPELLNPLWIMPPDIRHKAKSCGCDHALVENLLDTDPYLARLWFVTADDQSAQKKLGWLVNYHKHLKNIHWLRPAMLDELFNQVQLGHIPSNAIADIFKEIDGKQTIGQIAYNLGLYTTVDMDAIIQQAIRQNPQAVADYKAGKNKALAVILATSKQLGVTDMRKASQLLKERITSSEEKAAPQGEEDGTV